MTRANPKKTLIALPLNGLSLYMYWHINYFTLKWLRHYGWIIVHKHLVKLASTDEDNLTFCFRIIALYLVSSGLEVVTWIKKFSSFWLYHIKILEMVTWNTNDTKDNSIYIRDSIKCCKQIRVKGFITLIKKKEKSHPNRHIIMENVFWKVKNQYLLGQQNNLYEMKY